MDYILYDGNTYECNDSNLNILNNERKIFFLTNLAPVGKVYKYIGEEKKED